MLLPHFGLHQNFLDPLTTSDGKPYGPIKYKQIVKECYLISKNIHTSYNDILDMTPIERTYILEFLFEESEKLKQKIEETKQQTKNKS